MEVYSPEEQSKIQNAKASLSQVLPYAKIFLFFGIGLVITGIIGYGLPYLLDALKAGQTAYTVMLVISAIAVLPLSLIISFKGFNPNSIAVPICYFLYTVAFGVMMSSILWMLDASTAILAFAITGGVMLLMGIMGILVGPKMNSVLMVALTAMFGAMILTLINLFVWNETIYWITSFVIFGVVLLFTAFDFYHVKRIVNNSGNIIGRNLAIYCAYIFYSDFIYIFLRVALILANNKR